jgi:hypothetical protein
VKISPKLRRQGDLTGKDPDARAAAATALTEPERMICADRRQESGTGNLAGSVGYPVRHIDMVRTLAPPRCTALTVRGGR